MLMQLRNVYFEIYKRVKSYIKLFFIILLIKGQAEGHMNKQTYTNYIHVDIPTNKICVIYGYLRTALDLTVAPYM